MFSTQLKQFTFHIQTSLKLNHCKNLFVTRSSITLLLNIHQTNRLKCRSSATASVLNLCPEC